MNNHPFRFVAFAAALLAIGGSLSAQGPGPKRGRGFAGEAHGLRGLNLTDDQQTKVKAIHDAHQAAIKAKGEAAGAAHKALFEAMANPATDTNALKALHDKASAAQFELLLEHRAIRQEILPLLTAEQKAQFEKQPMGMMGPHPGFGPGRGHRPGGPGPGGMGAME